MAKGNKKAVPSSGKFFKFAVTAYNIKAAEAFGAFYNPSFLNDTKGDIISPAPEDVQTGCGMAATTDE